MCNCPHHDRMLDEGEFHDPELSLKHTMIAGSAAGISEHCAMFPLDTIKTRIMLDNQTKYTRMIQTGSLILKEEGASAFYKGMAPALISAVPAHAVLFTTYEFVKKNARQYMNDHSAYLAGAVGATIMHDTVTVPFDVVKQRMQARMYASSSECVRQTFLKEGPYAFVRSLPATYMLNIPHQAAHWLTYETAKIMTGKAIEEHVALDFFMCGALAGVFASFVSHPLDLVRTRIQLGGGAYPDVVRRVYRAEGLKGFWKGAVPRMAFYAPSAALMMMSYETVKRFLMTVDRGNKSPSPSK